MIKRKIQFEVEIRKSPPKITVRHVWDNDVITELNVLISLAD